MSAARKAALADPAVRAKMSAASKAALADPAVRAKMSAAIKAALAARCVYCNVQRSRYAKLQNDGPDTWCCVDELACERRIVRQSPAAAAFSRNSPQTSSQPMAARAAS
jgi:hypothetical protein